jgi:hypothetical protein
MVKRRAVLRPADPSGSIVTRGVIVGQAPPMVRQVQESLPAMI